jgi:hypothetical protein
MSDTIKLPNKVEALRKFFNDPPLTNKELLTLRRDFPADYDELASLAQEALQASA